jgi:rSAM/selenodomain-associated transferase 2
MKLSVIVPVLNEAAHLEVSLRALQELRARGAEVIVADGGSTDGTVRLALPLADQVLPAARGRASQMNAGAAVSRGEVLLFLHADTLLPDNADRLLLGAMAASGLCWGRFDVRISGRSHLFPLIASMMNLRSRLTGIATGDQGIFVRRRDFAAVGGFPAQPLMEDIAISVRLRRRSRPLCLRAAVTTSGRRWETRGAWRTVLLMWRLRLRYWLGVPPETLAEEYR